MTTTQKSPVIVKFENGQSHTYDNVPTDINPEDIKARASQDFPNINISSVERPTNENVQPQQVQNGELTPFQALLKGMSEPVIPEGRKPIAGAALAGLGGETLKNIGAATQLVSPTMGTPMVETGQAMVKGGDAVSPTATTVGQVGSYVVPMNALTKGARLLTSVPKTLLGNVTEQGLIGGATGFLTTPGEAKDRIGETFLNTAMGAGMPVAGEIVQAVGKKIAPILRNAPTQEQLVEKANNLFGIAKKSGVELNSKEFSNSMANMTKNYREEGYDPRLHPKLAVAIEELTNSSIPKDFNELKTLRKFIQNAQKSSDDTERKVATILKDDFDNYISNMPEESLIGGSKEGIKAWKEARDTYSKLSKADIFDEILKKAELDKTKFSQSGTENAMTAQLRNLAKNDRKMRLFSEEEQKAIIDAVKGNNFQNVLRYLGKYAPTSVISQGLGSSGGAGIGAFLGGPAGAVIGASVVPTVGGLTRSGATAMRKTQVQNLADLMRMGGDTGEVGSRLQLTPTQQNLAKMLMLQQSTQGEK